MKSYVLSLMAVDQVGIASAVTGAIRQLEGNIIELSQTVMGDFFTIILAVDVPDAVSEERLLESVKRSGSPFDLQVSIMRHDRSSALPGKVSESERYVLTVTGQDHPGVIHRIAEALAQRKISITDLYAVVHEGRFVMVLEVLLPRDVETPGLRDELQTVGASFGLSAAFQHENIFRATNSPRPVEVAQVGIHTHVSNG